MMSHKSKKFCGDTRQPSVLSFLGKDANNNDLPKSNEKNAAGNQEKPKFQTKWLKLNPWLTYDAEKDIMRCKLCIKCNFSNSMALGCNNFKTTTLTRHIDSSDHKRALRAETERENLEKTINKMDSKEYSGIILCMKVVYWMTKEGIAMTKYRSLMGLLKNLNTPNMEVLNVGDAVNYTSYNSACEFLAAVSEDIDIEVTKKLQKSPVITIMTDESTDIVVHHKLCITARIVDPVTLTPSTMFLTDLRITSGTGAAIFDAIKSHLSTRNIDISKVTG